MYCMVKKGWSSHTPACNTATILGWQSCAAAWISARNRSSSPGRESAPRSSHFMATTPAALHLQGPPDHAHPAPAQLVEQPVLAERDPGVGRLPLGAVSDPRPDPSIGRPSVPSPRRSRRSPRASGGHPPARDGAGPALPRRARDRPAGRRSARRGGRPAGRHRTARTADPWPATGLAGGPALVMGRRSAPADRRGRLGQDRPQPPQRPEMPHPGRGVAEPQHPGGLSVGELLEMPEQDDLAIVVVQQAEGLVEPAFQLEPEGQRRRA